MLDKKEQELKQALTIAGIPEHKHPAAIDRLKGVLVDAIFQEIEQEIERGMDGGRPYSYYASRLQAEGLKAAGAMFRNLAKKHEKTEDK